MKWAWGSHSAAASLCINIKSNPRSVDVKWAYFPFLLQLKGLFSTFCKSNIILLCNEIYSIKWVLHFQQIDHYFASSTLISPAQKILKPKESIHEVNVSYNMLAYIFSTIFIYLHTHTHTHTHIYIYIYIYICVYTYAYSLIYVYVRTSFVLDLKQDWVSAQQAQTINL